MIHSSSNYLRPNLILYEQSEVGGRSRQTGIVRSASTTSPLQARRQKYPSASQAVNHVKRYIFVDGDITSQKNSSSRVPEFIYDNGQHKPFDIMEKCGHRDAPKQPPVFENTETAKLSSQDGRKSLNLDTVYYTRTFTKDNAHIVPTKVSNPVKMIHPHNAAPTKISPPCIYVCGDTSLWKTTSGLEKLKAKPQFMRVFSAHRSHDSRKVNETKFTKLRSAVFDCEKVKSNDERIREEQNRKRQSGVHYNYDQLPVCERNTCINSSNKWQASLPLFNFSSYLPAVARHVPTIDTTLLCSRVEFGRRRLQGNCSWILPNLFVAGRIVAGNYVCLKTNKITHIINVAGESCPNYFAGSFKYLSWYIKDLKREAERLESILYRSLEFIDTAIQEGGQVLIHCQEGVSRSATIAVAYMMWKRRISYHKALKRVREQREICCPNAGFADVLLRFGERLAMSRNDFNELLDKEGSRPGSEVKLYRICPHHRWAPVLVLLGVSKCGGVMHKLTPEVELDPRFCYLLRINSLFILWIRKESILDLEVVGRAVSDHLKQVSKFEYIPQSMLTIRIINEDDASEESTEFWKWVMPTNRSVERSTTVSCSYQHNMDAQIIKTGVVTFRTYLNDLQQRHA